MKNKYKIFLLSEIRLIKSSYSHKGFTLIEILVVVSILGLLASITMVAVSKAREKARDARRQSDLRQLNAAINLYYAQFGKMPRNYNCYNWGNGTFSLCTGNSPATSGVCDAIVPGMPGADPAVGSINNLYPAGWDATMQQLVDAGILAKIPHSPGGPGYCYHDFGTTPNYAGAVLMTELETYQPSTTGIPPSCRPWTSVGATWCEQRSSTEYCMCNPY